MKYVKIRKTRRRIIRTVINLMISMLALFCFYPVLLTMTNSLMSKTEIIYRFIDRKWSIALIPSRVVLYEYYDLLIKRTDYIKAFWNSCSYSIIITVLAIIVGVLASFGFHYGKFPGKKILFFIYIVIMMMPLQVTLLPNYIGLRDLNLLDTRLAIILPAIFNPFAFFIIYQYMKGMHIEYIEAARLETSSILLILAKIVAPCLKTCMIAVFIFIFAENWNMVEQPIIYLEREELLPLSVQLSEIMKEEPNVGLSGAVIFMLPVLLIYLFFHESFEKGLEHLSLEDMNS